MKIGALKRFSVEDVPDAPPWFQDYLVASNQFQEQVLLALARNLSFGENTSSAIVEYTMVNATELSIKNPLSVRAIGAVPLYAANPATGVAVTMELAKFRPLEENRIGLTVTHGVSGTVGALVRWLIVGG